MKRLSKKTDINKGQEVPSINLNLQTRAAQYLVQQGQTKKRGRWESNKNKFFLIFFYKCKIKTTYKGKHADSKNKAKGSLMYNHPTNSRMN